MRLMAPNDVVGAAKIPSAHPTAGLLAADVPCRLAMSNPDDGQTLFCGYKFRPSLNRIRLREASKQDDAGKSPAGARSSSRYPSRGAERAGMTAELTQTLAEHGISSSVDMSTDTALVYRLLDSVAADGGLTEDAKKEVRARLYCAVRCAGSCCVMFGVSQLLMMGRIDSRSG